MPALNAAEKADFQALGDPYAALKQALADARAAWYEPATNAFDYRAYAVSAHHGALARAAVALRGFAPEKLNPGKRLPFWLNAYNALVLQAVVARGPAGAARMTAAFFAESSFVVGGLEFSLDDIEHGLIRGNAPRFRSLRRQMPAGDPRLACAPYAFDERAHFALHSACRSSPRLHVYGKDTVIRAIEEAASEYVCEHARVEQDGAVLRLPKIFQWYAPDFGGEAGVRVFVINRLEREQDLEALERQGMRCALRYDEFDWTLNQR